MLEKHLNHTFKNKQLLKLALTHASVDGEKSNERLEFLGDHVLGLVMANWLFDLYPDEPEGLLSKRLSALVRKEMLAKIAEKISVADHLKLGEGEPEMKTGYLADAVEALIAALYLDGGFDKADAFIKKYWQEELGDIRLSDGKSSLQEYLQGKNMPLPTYTVTSSDGPAHDIVFTVRVTCDAGEADGQGGSKQKAEQAAADALLAKLGVETQ